MPPGIRDPELLGLLGDILGPGRSPAAGAMRLRLMQQAFSWRALVDLAMGQDILLPLIFALTARGLLPPVPRSIKDGDSHVTAKLGEVYRRHLARRQSEKRQIEEVLSVLDGADIVSLILKGARYLVEPVASWCEARSMADFDIMVRPGDAERALSVLKAEGYRQGISYMPDYHHFPELQRAGEPAAIELHTNALSVAGQRIISTEHVWAHANKAGGGSFFIMPIRWHALLGLVHHQISDRGHIRRILAVKGLWEWTMLARGFSGEDWDAIAAHMEATGVTDVLGSWLLQSHRLFGLEIPGSMVISATAQAHANATFRLASQPHWTRRAKFIADQLRFSFARETLALRYGKPPSRVSLVDAGRYLVHLFRQHRGRALRRLTGYRDRLS